MKSKDIINSYSYWDTRFAKDWESFHGPAQSRFFAQLTIDNLPRWLIEQLQRQQMMIADWGCAQGDGTDVWASYLDPQQIVGIDFSSVAVEQAAKRYPAIRFISEDWLTNQSKERMRFDVIFSSNTLEHFHRPYAALETLSDRATKALILTLPYRELERHQEHFYTFLPDNIPTAVSSRFRLVWARVLDCRQVPNTLWDGEQIILVYAEANWVDELVLPLRDLNIEQSDLPAVITNLNQVVIERDSQITNLNQAVIEQDSQITNLNQAVIEHDEGIARVKSEKLELHTRLMSMSDWATYADKHPIKHAFKKTALGIARGTLHSLPVPIATKRRLRNFFFAAIRLLRQPVRNKTVSVGQAKEVASAIVQKPSARLARDVFVFAVIDWHFRIQRPQHIARSLAESGHRVYYFSNHFIDADEPGYQLERLTGADALYQIKLHVKGAPAIYFDPPSEQALAMLTSSIAKVIEDFNAISSFSIVQHAFWYPLVKQLPNTYRIYDCMDYHEGFGKVPAKLVEIERELLGSADLVTVTSSWLEDFARKHNPSVALVRNAAEYAHFVTQPERVYKDAKARRIIGYYGAIAEWFDLDLVRAIALIYPDCLILLVGNDTVGAQKALDDLPNVEFAGEVPYSLLPFYLHAFDVCILPFKVTQLTLATNPVKVYEYLAAGKPAVCVDLPEVVQFGDLVSCACSSEDFLVKVGSLLQETGVVAEQKSTMRRRFASEQTWSHRGKELASALEAVKMPRISVIILTFNNIDLTRACLESVLLHSDYPNLEVIVVDNASSDGTPAYLEDFASRYPRVQVVLNSENLGFAAGNNIGLSIATGDYLVILNNDTVVTHGWVMTLLRHFQQDPNLGLIGPVTNNIGNEARIETRYQNIAEMPAEALQFTLANMGKTYPMRTTAFFCVMLPRAVFELCGPICEDYGRGFFEDDDYCRRVESIGKRIVCADDVFIHHHLSASFNTLKDEERIMLFQRNKQVYENKWGFWEPHVYRQKYR